MSRKVLILSLLVIFVVAGVVIASIFTTNIHKKFPTKMTTKPTPSPVLYPLSITAMQARSYPGSNITIEQTLPDKTNYHQYLTSYMSDGLKINALLTVPSGDKPKDGWPVIVFNHGYIAPETYQTNPSVGQYATYVPIFASANYIVFKPDYRGNGDSEGKPEGAYYSPAYTVDDLNAIASIQEYKDANPDKIGVWGHSMGGNITLRDLVVRPNEIKAAVIWGGVVGSYTNLEHWHDPSYHPSAYELSLRYKYRSTIEKQHGTPKSDPNFWKTIDPTSFVGDITTPIQLHVGAADEEVPISYSAQLYDKLKSAGKTAEFYSYPGADHNISQGFTLAMQRSLAFFDKYLK